MQMGGPRVLILKVPYPRCEEITSAGSRRKTIQSTMFAVQKTSIARNTVVCAAQKPVQAKVRRERRTSRQLNFPRGCPARGFGGHAPFSSIYFRIDPILDIAAPAARIFPRDAVSLSLPVRIPKANGGRPRFAFRAARRVDDSLRSLHITVSFSSTGRAAAEGRPRHHCRVRRLGAAERRHGGEGSLLLRHGLSKKYKNE